jgi:hypothetical protein
MPPKNTKTARTIHAPFKRLDEVYRPSATTEFIGRAGAASLS